MKGFNVSAWALEHKSFVGFLLVLIALAGIMAYGQLGRDEDPPFTVKVMIVRAMWPAALMRASASSRAKLIRTDVSDERPRAR